MRSGGKVWSFSSTVWLTTSFADLSPPCTPSCRTPAKTSSNSSAEAEKRKEERERERERTRLSDGELITTIELKNNNNKENQVVNEQTRKGD